MGGAGGGGGRGGGGREGYNGRDGKRQNKLRTEPFSDELHRFDIEQVCRVAKIFEFWHSCRTG